MLNGTALTLRTALNKGSIALALLTAGIGHAAAEELSFTAAQVGSGKAIYQEICQLCHGTTLSNGQFGTPLRGSYFRNKWAGKSLGELLQFTYESMPPDNKSSLAPEQYAAVLSYILSRNDLMPGSGEMPANPQALTTVMLPWEPK